MAAHFSALFPRNFGAKFIRQTKIISPHWRYVVCISKPVIIKSWLKQELVIIIRKNIFINNGYVPGDYLEESLKQNGISTTEITDVLLTHLHWDHCSGSVKNTDGEYQLTFPNAKHWCSKKQWKHSQISNAREKAAYHREVLDFLSHSEKLNLLEKEGELFPGIETRFYDGHTPGQIIPFIHFDGRTVVYTSDLIPTAANIPLLWLASYDLYPVKTLEEKEQFLEEAAAKNYVLFFEHDYFTECATVLKNEKGGFQIKEKFNWSER